MLIYFSKKNQKRIRTTLLVLIYVFVILSFESLGQDSKKGITEVNKAVRSWLAPVSNLVLALGGVIGFIGAVRVYIKWNSGDQDVQKTLMSWMGACLFLVMVGIMIKAFFGLTF
ncbi:MAG: DUF4134 domain-containing protein [Flavobacteriaceae bacterium]|nr:DUF4134 domain-containing protein [Flavobacteriaceae bacterium]MCY4216598.1 DUF4134 domain-containing protein [Flavobacteriaceae bacterium]MCY4253505.1 DUF4134 domain-containing protein [Flavobacteriaceae bacterium]